MSIRYSVRFEGPMTNELAAELLARADHLVRAGESGVVDTVTVGLLRRAAADRAQLLARIAELENSRD